jgi:hypothetical protein
MSEVRIKFRCVWIAIGMEPVLITPMRRHGLMVITATVTA